MFSPDARAEGLASSTGFDVSVATEWLVRAQDGQAAAVVSEIEVALRRDLDPLVRVRAMFAQSIALLMLGRGDGAVEVCRDLCALCRDLGLKAAGVRARALLVDLLRRRGEREQAAEQLALAVAMEPSLEDLKDPEVQSALGALAVSLRLSGVTEEAYRIEDRLEAVEHLLPNHQRVSRLSNLAFEHVVRALTPLRRAPFHADGELLEQAARQIERARRFAWEDFLEGRRDSYEVVAAESTVLAALPEAFCGDPAVGLRRLRQGESVLERGVEADTAQLLWAAGTVRAMVRLGRHTEAGRTGRDVLAKVPQSGREGDRMILAYETMRAEHTGTEYEGSGTAEFVRLTQERLDTDLELVGALFRARVDLIRGADERRSLAREASLDSLTGLINRRGAAAALADAAALQPGEPAALLLIDLDGFKDVNDTCGHLAGDVVLQRVASALRTAARANDVVARWGGDEFVVICALDPDRALALADRLRETIRLHSGEVASSRVTGSIGVAVRLAPIEEEVWLTRADEAMYAAKRSGGDATVLG